MKPRIGNLAFDDAEHIMSTYGVHVIQEPKRLTSGVANASFLVETDQGKYVVSILENHTLESSEYLNVITNKLVEFGVRTPPIISNVDGVQVVQFQDCPLVVRPFVEGREADPRSGHESAAVGMELAAVHLSAQQMPEGEYSRRIPHDWRSKISSCGDAEFLEWIEVVSSRFDSECVAMPIGFTHGDLFPDNVMITRDGSAVLLDWETASIDVLVYDLAIAVIGFMTSAVNSGRYVVQGYESKRRISEKERSFFVNAFDYGCAVLAFHRFLRHNVLYPGTGRETAYRQLFDWNAALTISDVRSIVN